MRLHLTYRGRVQGVGFRATARAIAARHPITGWVRNAHDGSVELEAQGPPAALEAFRADLRQFLSRHIETESEYPLPDSSESLTFEIRR